MYNLVTRTRAKFGLLFAALTACIVAPGLALASGGTDYSAWSDSLDAEVAAGKPTLLLIMGGIIALSALFVLYRRSKSATK